VRHDSEDLVARAAAELRQPTGLSAGFDARVMAAVRQARRPSRWVLAWEWVREPRLVALSPLGGLAMAASVAALVTLGVWAAVPRGVTPGVASSSAELGEVVQFVLHAPAARAVAIAGDFNGWDAERTPLVAAGSGVWSVALRLAPGRYTYTFVVDGTRFVADPAAPRAVGDDFGTPSSVVTVGRGTMDQGRAS
jgi:hypothetical protein